MGARRGVYIVPGVLHTYRYIPRHVYMGGGGWGRPAGTIASRLADMAMADR